MNKTNEVIVVTPKKYIGLGRKLSHEISKQMKGISAANWSVEKYEANEFQ